MAECCPTVATNGWQPCDSWRFSRQFCKGAVIKSVTFYFFRVALEK